MVVQNVPIIRLCISETHQNPSIHGLYQLTRSFISTASYGSTPYELTGKIDLEHPAIGRQAYARMESLYIPIR